MERALHRMIRCYLRAIFCLLLTGFTSLFGGMDQGSLIPVSSVSTGSSPLGVAFGPTSTSLTSTSPPAVNFADTAAEDTIYIYKVDQESGEVDYRVNEIQTGAIATCIAYSPPAYSTSVPIFAGVTYNGKGSEDASGFSIYSVNFPKGDLSLLRSYSFPGGAQTIAFSPLFTPNANTYQLFAAVASPAYLDIFSVDVSTGALTRLQSYSLPANYENPSVSFGYYPNTLLFTAALSLAPKSGSSTGSGGLIQFYPFTISSGGFFNPPSSESQVTNFYPPIAYPGSIAFPTWPWGGFGLFAAVTDYAASGGTNGLYIYQLAQNGSQVTATQTAVANTGLNPLGVAFSNPMNNYVVAEYITVANSGSDTLSVFNISQSGTLTELNTSPIHAGSSPAYVAYSPYFNTFVEGQSVSYMYLAATNNGSSNISFYKVNFVGSPTNVSGEQIAEVNDSEVAVTGGSRAKRPSKIEYVNTLTWDPPKNGVESIAYYEVAFIKNGKKKVLAQIPKDSPRKFSHGGRKPCSKDRYKIYTVDENGERSPPAKVTVVGKKAIFFKVLPCTGNSPKRGC